MVVRRKSIHNKRSKKSGPMARRFELKNWFVNEINLEIKYEARSFFQCKEVYFLNNKEKIDALF